MSSHSRSVPIARIERVALWTDQLGRLRDFYAHWLGAQASPIHVDPGSGLRAVLLDFCGVGLELIVPPTLAEHPPEKRGSGHPYIALSLGSADAVDRLTTGLAAAGHQVIEPPRRSWEGAYRSVVLDPDGNRVELTV